MIKYIKHSYMGLKRKEKDGSYFCIPQTTQFPIFINPTAYQIFELCDGKTTEEVIKEMLEQYPQAEEKIIRKDVKNTLWYLFNIGIITKPDNVEKVIENFCSHELRILDEQDYLLAFNFIQEILKSKNEENICCENIEVRGLPKENVSMFYDLPQMRMRNVMGKETYFQLHKVDGKIEVVLGTTIHKFRKVVYVESLFAKDISDLIEALNLISGYYSTLDFEKIKLYITTTGKDSKYANILTESGFIQEATLSSEARNWIGYN